MVLTDDGGPLESANDDKGSYKNSQISSLAKQQLHNLD